MDELIEKMGMARAALGTFEKSAAPSLSVEEAAVVNPQWRITSDSRIDDSRAGSIEVGLRHSSYGWLSFVLPVKEARDLGEWLIDVTSGR